MRFNFRGVYISLICNFRVFHIFKFVVAGYSGVEIFAGEIFADIRSEFVYHNSIRYLLRCKTCWTRCWICLKMSLYRMESCIWRFHIYEEVWTFIGDRLGYAGERSNKRRSVRSCNEGRHWNGRPCTAHDIVRLYALPAAARVHILWSYREQQPSVDLSPF